MNNSLPPDTVCPVERFAGLDSSDYWRIRAAEARADGHPWFAAGFEKIARDCEGPEFLRLAKGMLAQVGLNFWEVTKA
jgi:hypothetical protein